MKKVAKKRPKLRWWLTRSCPDHLGGWITFSKTKPTNNDSPFAKYICKDAVALLGLEDVMRQVKVDQFTEIAPLSFRIIKKASRK